MQQQQKDKDIINNSHKVHSLNFKKILLTCSFFCISMLFLLMIIVPVEALSIGVNKAKISFEDVLRGGYAEETVTISTDSPGFIGGLFEVEGDIAEWVSFEPANVTDEGFIFSAGNPMDVTIIIQPPADSANDRYNGSIRVITGEVGRDGGGLIGTSTRVAVRIATAIGITGVERRECIMGGIKLTSTEVDQPVDISYYIKNTGNVRIDPDLSLTVYDQLQDAVVLEKTFTTRDRVLPTASSSFIEQISHDLTQGQYWARVTSPDCSGEKFLTFDVLDRGGVLDSGELIAINAEPWNRVGDIIPIEVLFRNTGPRTVSAKFKGTIMLDKKLVKVIDTDFYNTPPGEVATIETFFNPSERGQYEVSGRVLYNNKVTFPRSAIINVLGEGESRDQGLTQYIVYFLIFITIVFFLLLIIKKKKRRRYY